MCNLLVTKSFVLVSVLVTKLPVAFDIQEEGHSGYLVES